MGCYDRATDSPLLQRPARWEHAETFGHVDQCDDVRVIWRWRWEQHIASGRVEDFLVDNSMITSLTIWLSNHRSCRSDRVTVRRFWLRPRIRHPIRPTASRETHPLRSLQVNSITIYLFIHSLPPKGFHLTRYVSIADSSHPMASESQDESPKTVTAVAEISQSTGKSGRNKGHRFSSSSSGPGGDTASSSSTVASQYSSHSGNQIILMVIIMKKTNILLMLFIL